MSKLKSKSDVIEWYWPDFLNFCMKDHKYRKDQKVIWAPSPIHPTVDNFWLWYISDGPLGVKEAGRYYTKTEVVYI